MANSGKVELLTKNMEIYLEGGQDAVLLIHGLTGSPFEMAYMAKKLNRAGFTVKVPCLSGHGTTIEELKKTKWQDWYKTVAETFEELRKNYTSVAVAGLCAGAVLALYLAYEAKNEVSAIALLSTILFYDGWSLPWYKFLLPMVCYTPLRFIVSYKEKEPYGTKNERLRRQIAKAMKEEAVAYPEFPCISMCEYLKLVKIVKKILPEITTPTLIIHSIEDDMASIKNVDYIEKYIGAKTVRKVLLHNSYHMIPMDNDRELATEEIIRFFRENVK